MPIQHAAGQSQLRPLRIVVALLDGEVVGQHAARGKVPLLHASLEASLVAVAVAIGREVAAMAREGLIALDG